MSGLLLQELRFSVRALARSPWFTCTAIAMLGVGLGLTMFMFGAVQSFLLRPPPFLHGEELLHVEYADSASQDDSIDVPTGDFLAMRREQQVFRQFEAFSQGTVNLSGDGRAERYNGGFVTSSTFAALGVQPLLGAGFVDGDDLPGAPLKVALGHALWQQRFNADPEIVGKTVRANGRPATVVAVMPEGFLFPFQNDLWLPLNSAVATQPRREQFSLEVWGRPREGVTAQQASDALGALLARIESDDTGEPLADRVVVKPFQQEFVGDDAPKVIGTMFVSVFLVLAIACANVANLMVARSARRARETAIRNAIGASRWRLVVAGLSETMLIAGAAMLVGFVLAQIAAQLTMQALRSSEEPPPYWMTEIHIDAAHILFAVGTALAAALLAGLWPAWRAAKAAAAETMRSGGAGSLGSNAVARSLTTVEIALCMVLLVTSGLTIRSVIERTTMDQPFTTAGVLTGRLGLFDSVYPADADVLRFTEALQQRLAATPGVQAAGITSSVPFSFAGGDFIRLEGRAPAADGRLQIADTVSADPGYFAALEIPLLRGRLLDARDDADAPRVAVIGEPLAEKFWPGEDPLGKRFRLGRDDGAPWIEVVGVVPHIVQVGDEPDRAVVYVPFAQQPTRFFSFAVRGPGDPFALAEPVRTAVTALDADLPVYWLRSLREWIDLAAFDHRLMASLFGLFGLFAVVLAAAGLYAVLAYQVSQRIREIGVRRALGANDGGIVRMVVKQGAWQLGIGVGIGLVLALGFAQLLSSQLFGVSAHDPLTFGGVALLLAVVTLVAALVPTRRALGVTPMVALRYE